MTTCTISGCAKKTICRGLCSGHYHRWQRYGDPCGGGPSKSVYLKWLRGHVSHSESGCLIWPFYKCGDGRGGYVIFRGRQMSAARIMCILANGDPPIGASLAAHSCGNGSGGCVHPLHLDWSTSQQNQLDRVRDQTDNRGEKNGQAKLTEDDVRRIRRLMAMPRRPSYEKIGSMFGVSKGQIIRIAQRKAWSWLS